VNTRSNVDVTVVYTRSDSEPDELVMLRSRRTETPELYCGDIGSLDPDVSR